MQTYLDFTAPLKAAGAIQNKEGDWHFPDKPEKALYAAQFLREHGLCPLRVDPPKGRSFAAIRRSHSKFRSTRTPGDKAWQAMRAFQYMAAMRGRETGFQEGRFSHVNNVRFDVAPDGSRRVRYVFTDLDKDWVEVPHWDFVPSVIEQICEERDAA
ncbi:hypothetical protein RZ532_01045 [Nitratireductor aquimarinus]|uniref:hypothetical protein n=1 Tax=Nitratireductor aquimarinus TaxID=889300 RepID=UPI0029364F6F|nr:hypothetical protein [Nitratireductor aquimarinus]MDV2964547.1 hypothetical protein [Nitratireductor aquimarinus]